MVASVRAELASLALELRVVDADARAVELEALGTADEAAQAFVTSSLGQTLEQRRAQLAREVELARIQAACWVRAAEAEASAIVAAARAGNGPSLTPGADRAGPFLAAFFAEQMKLGQPLPPREPALPAASVMPVDARPAAQAAAGSTPMRPIQPAHRPPVARTRSSSRSGVRRFLYLDVVLPMLAVLIVFVILVAWVG